MNGRQVRYSGRSNSRWSMRSLHYGRHVQLVAIWESASVASTRLRLEKERWRESREMVVARRENDADSVPVNNGARIRLRPSRNSKIL